jgi:hypothetical protein
MYVEPVWRWYVGKEQHYPLSVRRPQVQVSLKVIVRLGVQLSLLPPLPSDDPITDDDDDDDNDDDAY